MNIEMTLQKVASSGRTSANPETRIISDEAQWPMGKVVRQGDVMIRRLPLQDTEAFLVAAIREAQAAVHAAVPSAKFKAQASLAGLEKALSIHKLLPKAEIKEDRQVAPGTTQGSRHIVHPGSATVHTLPGADALTGPTIVAKAGFYLEHPTHADFNAALPGCYQVTFPRDLTGEAREEAKRRAD